MKRTRKKTSFSSDFAASGPSKVVSQLLDASKIISQIVSLRVNECDSVRFCPTFFDKTNFFFFCCKPPFFEKLFLSSMPVLHISCKLFKWLVLFPLPKFFLSKHTHTRLISNTKHWNLVSLILDSFLFIQASTNPKIFFRSFALHTHVRLTDDTVKDKNCFRTCKSCPMPVYRINSLIAAYNPLFSSPTQVWLINPFTIDGCNCHAIRHKKHTHTHDKPSQQ